MLYMSKLGVVSQREEVMTVGIKMMLMGITWALLAVAFRDNKTTRCLYALAATVAVIGGLFLAGC